MQKLAMHAGGCAHDGGEKKNVLIVSVSLPIAVNFALCSNSLSFGNRTQNTRVASARPNHQPIGGSDQPSGDLLESLFVDSCFYPAERARSGPDE